MEEIKTSPIRKLGEIRMVDDACPEEIEAIRRILIKAGLLVESRGRDLMICQIREDKS